MTQAAGIRDFRIRLLGGVHRQLLLRPEGRQDLGRVRRREHLRYGSVLDVLAVDGDRVTAGQLPDHIQLRLGGRPRDGDLSGHSCGTVRSDDDLFA
jgi:hypothetical protein